MTEPVGSVRRTTGPRRIRGRRAADGASTPHAAEAAAPASAAAAVDPIAALLPIDPAPVISAHIMGQGPADSAPPANAAQTARKAYLAVEWSGRADRRNRRGRIAKTDV